MRCPYTLIIIAAACLFSSCAHEEPEVIKYPPAPYIIGQTRGVPVPPPPTPPPKYLPASTPPIEPPVSSSNTPTISVKTDPPVAVSVPGHPGFVKSPFGATGMIDVRGMAPGTLARDPFTGKIFQIPTE